MLGLPYGAVINGIGLALGGGPGPVDPLGMGNPAGGSTGGSVPVFHPGSPAFRTPVVLPANAGGGVFGETVNPFNPFAGRTATAAEVALARRLGISMGALFELQEESRRWRAAQFVPGGPLFPPNWNALPPGGTPASTPAPSPPFSWGRAIGNTLIYLDLLGQSGHGPGAYSFPEQPPARPAIPGPRGTFYWTPPRVSDLLWTSKENWSIGGLNAIDFQGVPGPGDPVVFDGTAFIRNGACTFPNPPSGPICSSMLFANGWNGTLKLTGSSSAGATIANLVADTSSSPTITCDIGDLNLAGVCSISSGTFSVSGAKLIIAPDASVTVGQITFAATALLVGPGKSVLIVAGGGITASIPQGPITLTSANSSLAVLSNTTIDGFVINQGGTVQVGTRAGAGDDMTTYTLTVKSSLDNVSYYQDSGSLNLYNGGSLNLAGGMQVAGGTVATGYTVAGKSQSFVTFGLGKFGNGGPGSVDFTGGTISPGSLDSNKYCNLRFLESGAGHVAFSGTTLALPVNGQTPGTGVSISSNVAIQLTGSNILQVTDGSGAGVVSGTWTLIPAPVVSGDFTTKTLPNPTQEFAGVSGTSYVFKDMGVAIGTACSAANVNTTLSAVVTNGGVCNGTYALYYASGKWQDNLTTFGLIGVAPPGAVFILACGAVNAGIWNLGASYVFVAGPADADSQPAGHGDIVFTGINLTGAGGGANATVTITI
jgi:hypothetical protein